MWDGEALHTREEGAMGTRVGPSQNMVSIDPKTTVQNVYAVSHDARQPMYALEIRLDLLEGALFQQRRDTALREIAEIRHCVAALRHVYDRLTTVATASPLSMAVDEQLEACVSTDVLDASVFRSISTTRKQGPREDDLTNEAVDATALFARLQAVHEVQASTVGVAMRWRHPPAGTVQFKRSDAERLWQALTNIVSNAIKYSDPSKWGHQAVLVALTQCAGHLRFDVVDNGVGVSACWLSHVWRRQFRVPDARIAHVPGTGLGLSIVAEALDALGVHQRRFLSVPGRGSRVSVWLPRSETRSGSTSFVHK